MEYLFKPRAFRQLQKLPKEIQRRILDKLDDYCSQNDPIEFAEPLVRSEIGHYRFRVGDYRIIFDLDSGRIQILLVGHRRKIYR